MLYVNIAREITRDILAGKYQVSNKLPAELQLAKKYDTSKMTVRKALDVLRESGIIYSIPKQGYYINSIEDIQKFNALTGNSVTLLDKRATLKSKVISYNIIESNPQFDLIFKKKCKKLIRIQRLRYLNDALYCVETVFIDYNLFPELQSEVAENSLYQYVQSCGYKIATNLKTLRASFAPVEFYEYEPNLAGKPLIEIENIGFLTNGQVFEYSLAYNVDAAYSSYIKYENILNLL